MKRLLDAMNREIESHKAKKNVSIYKGSKGEYHVTGGDLDDAIFFLKPNRHEIYGIEEYKKVTINHSFNGLPNLTIIIDECNPIDSLMFTPSTN